MNIAVMGRRGEGKSTLTLFLSKRIQERVGAHTVAIFDPKRSFKTVPHTSDIEEFEAAMETRGNWAVAYQPSGRNEEMESVEVSEQFDEFIEALGIEFHLGVRDNPPRNNLRPFVLVVDEAWLLQSRGTVNGSLANLVRLADSKNFYLIQVAHRPNDFGTATRAQVDELFLFRQWLESDLDIIAEWCGEEVAEKVAALPLHHLVRYEICSGKSEDWNKPSAWFMPDKGNENVNTVNSGEEGTSASAGSAGTRRDDAVATHV
jgi:hypothetical protein